VAQTTIRIQTPRRNLRIVAGLAMSQFPVRNLIRLGLAENLKALLARNLRSNFAQKIALFRLPFHPLFSQS
jgi:hypothetical protein